MLINFTKRFSFFYINKAPSIDLNLCLLTDIKTLNFWFLDKKADVINTIPSVPDSSVRNESSNIYDNNSYQRTHLSALPKYTTKKENKEERFSKLLEDVYQEKESLIVSQHYDSKIEDSLLDTSRSSLPLNEFYGDLLNNIRFR